MMCQQTGFCFQGCKWGAKWSAGYVDIPEGEATGNLEVRSNSHVARILHNEDGKVTGIISNGEKATAPLIICDPSYVKGLNKTKVVGRVIRAICIIDHPIPNTNNASSVQIILPQRQLNRKSGKLNFFSDWVQTSTWPWSQTSSRCAPRTSTSP